MTPKIEAMLREFDQKFDASKDPALWVKLVEEEVEEFRAGVENLIKELGDIVYVMAGLKNLVGEDQMPALIGHITCLDQGLLNDIMGAITDHVDAEELLGRIHASNMSKLGDDGKPVRRDDGKILKGPNYKLPYLRDLIEPENKIVVN